MTCCPTESDAKLEGVANGISNQPCTNCKGQGRPVSRKTVLLMLKPPLLEEAMTGTYSFCAARDCPVVYFEEQGIQGFTTDDLRVPVGIKATEDPILCATALASMRVILAMRSPKQAKPLFPKEFHGLFGKVFARASHAILRAYAAWAK